MADWANRSTAGNGDGEFKTFMGAGFGTMMVRLSAGTKPTPPVPSNRAYLRAGLPAVYQEEATSGCASSAPWRSCWTRSWPCSTRCPRTSIPTTRRATSSPAGRLARRRPRRVAGDPPPA